MRSALWGNRIEEELKRGAPLIIRWNPHPGQGRKTPFFRGRKTLSLQNMRATYFPWDYRKFQFYANKRLRDVDRGVCNIWWSVPYSRDIQGASVCVCACGLDVSFSYIPPVKSVFLFVLLFFFVGATAQTHRTKFRPFNALPTRGKLLRAAQHGHPPHSLAEDPRARTRVGR